MGGFDLRDLTVPVLVAPMAGGPTTPELAAAGSSAGGLGFLAAGYLKADALADRVAAARALTSGPLGVNLFVPQPSAVTAESVDRYAAELAGETQRYGTALGEPRFDDDDWAAKLALVRDLRPEVVSFTFGVPTAEECASLRDAGITTMATVTTTAEAQRAVQCGVDALVAQGPSAGGHRGTFDPTAAPASQSLTGLLTSLHDAGVPLVGAGGLSTGDDIAAVLAAGAVAAQLGTAFLLADEAGSSPVHRAALQDPVFTETIVTKAFSGRYARGLYNRFVREHEEQAPLGYPEIHYLTGPVRAAAVRAGDADGTNVWAGTGFRNALAAPAAQIIGALT